MWIVTQRPISTIAAQLRANIQTVIIGKDDVIDLALVALLCEGHILLEDVPGIGKTTLAKAIARSLDCTFKRIQFTPDLLPSDVTGISYYNQKQQVFEFRAGPIFSQVVLADEINRATPRTQSALLEAMQERQVTVDGQTMPLARPFLVLATQNPIELEGTFPLPEAQVDRFMLRISLGYPEVEEEHLILARFERSDPFETLAPVVKAEELLAVQQQVRTVRVERSVSEYIVNVCRATRAVSGVQLGVSPRGTLALYHAAQAFAAIRGREFVLPDDVKTLVPYALAHRIVVDGQSRLRGRKPEDILRDVLERMPVPVDKV
ncbi:MAG TPA: MoxR family ATPase [Anaerolineae bacterium]|jgi:MoxR-like ATPase